MKIVDVQQGTPEWRAHRFSHRNASDAPAMMGASPYKSRNQLLKELALGLEEEVSEFKQALFDKGHAAEAMARPFAEEAIGQELFPVVGVSDEHPTMSASFDGLTLDESIGFECKLWRQDLAECLSAEQPALPMLYVWQLEHQALVVGSGLKKILFTICDPDNSRGMTHEYTPNPELQKQLLAGWAQFEIDLANYKHEDVPAPVVAKKVEALPALLIQVTGKVATSNFADFSKIVKEYISDINTDLQTDEHFADAESDVKWCSEVESKIAFVKEQALGQTADIDKLFKAMDDIAESARQKRLALEKLVKSQKEKIRANIIATANTDLRAHLEACNKTLGRVRVPEILVNFAEVIKGKRTVSSLRAAIDTELARVKIHYSTATNHIASNLALFDSITSGLPVAHLFGDLQQICVHPAEAFSSLVQGRVQAEQARVEKVKADAAEQERQRVERERVEAEERQKKADQQAQEDAARKAATPLQTGHQPTGSNVMPPPPSGGSAVMPAPVTSQATLSTTAIVEGPGTVSTSIPLAAKRPTNNQLTAVIAAEYKVGIGTARQWLMDFAAVEKDVAA